MNPVARIDVLTLFPSMLDGFLSCSMLGRAVKQGRVVFGVHDLRGWSNAKSLRVDDRPFGGGPGMVLEADPVFRALEHLRTPQSRVVYLCPDGHLLTGQRAEYLADIAAGEPGQEGHLIFLSGHYEGIDQRVRDHAVDLELSIGDYVLTNGTLAAAVAIDALCRHIPGVLGEEKSLEEESFCQALLGFPQYTRPVSYRGWGVPEVLLSGDHGAIAHWRYRQRLEKTRRRRPDLFHQHHSTTKTV